MSHPQSEYKNSIWLQSFLTLWRFALVHQHSHIAASLKFLFCKKKIHLLNGPCCSSILLPFIAFNIGIWLVYLSTWGISSCMPLGTIISGHHFYSNLKTALRCSREGVGGNTRWHTALHLTPRDLNSVLAWLRIRI